MPPQYKVTIEELFFSVEIYKTQTYVIFNYELKNANIYIVTNMVYNLSAMI
jgi:hypothetical protein